MEETKHLAQTLTHGDIIKATIRHKTDGSKNLINVDVMFLECNLLKPTINAVYKNKILEIPFNEISLKKERRGGKRPGAGNKPKPYPVKQMGMRVPLEVFELCNEACIKISKEYEINFEKSLHNQK